MNSVYESMISGLSEAIADAKTGGKMLQRKTITIVPVKMYEAVEIQHIRKRTGMSQKVFASYMGVSQKTVEAWEAGRNHPSGTASRILSMMEMDEKLTEKYPFVKN